MKAKLMSLLLTLMLMLPAFAVSAQDDDIDIREIIKQVCDEINEGCPEMVDDDFYLLSLIVEDDDLVMYFMFTDDTDFSQWDDDDIKDYNEILEEDLCGDEFVESLKELCRMANLGLVLKVSDINDNELSTVINVNE